MYRPEPHVGCNVRAFRRYQSMPPKDSFNSSCTAPRPPRTDSRRCMHTHSRVLIAERFNRVRHVRFEANSLPSLPSYRPLAQPVSAGTTLTRADALTTNRHSPRIPPRAKRAPTATARVQLAPRCHPKTLSCHPALAGRSAFPGWLLFLDDRPPRRCHSRNAASSPKVYCMFGCDICPACLTISEQGVCIDISLVLLSPGLYRNVLS